MGKRKKILVLLLLIEIIGIMVLTFSYPSVFQAQTKKPVPPSATQDIIPSVEEAKWRSYIKEVGSKVGYMDFKKAYALSPASIQHQAVHIMGRLLYKINGVNAITICDNFGAEGCYHGLFGEAIQTEGLANIKAMDNACVEKDGANKSECQHGIGHGLIAYMGSEKLVEALDICDGLTFKGRVSGCKTGVFMEYNFNTVTHDDSPKPRLLKTNAPYEPCPSIPEKYQYVCYHQQPELWDSFFERDYKTIGELCDNLDNRYKEICFFATGIEAANSSEFIVDRTIKECDEIVSLTGNMLCKSGARYQYRVFLKPLKDMDTICNTLDKSFRHECVEKSKAVGMF